MPLQNQQTDLAYLVKINNNEITEHNRKTSISYIQSGSDVTLDAGITKRYVQKNKKSFSMTFSFLPDLDTYTVDGRKSRNYLKSLSEIRGTISLSIKLDPLEPFKNYICYVTSYGETLVRRDIQNKLSFYDVSIVVEEQ